MNSTTWERTMELRFHIEDGMKILQQKFVGYKTMVVSPTPNFTQTEDVLTGEIEWRDVPLVEAKDESTE